MGPEICVKTFQQHLGIASCNLQFEAILTNVIE